MYSGYILSQPITYRTNNNLFYKDNEILLLLKNKKNFYYDFIYIFASLYELLNKDK